MRPVTLVLLNLFIGALIPCSRRLSQSLDLSTEPPHSQQDGEKRDLSLDYSTFTHCRMIRFQKYESTNRQNWTVKPAVEKININSDLLSDVSPGYKIYVTGGGNDLLQKNVEAVNEGVCRVQTSRQSSRCSSVLAIVWHTSRLNSLSQWIQVILTGRLTLSGPTPLDGSGIICICERSMAAQQWLCSLSADIYTGQDCRDSNTLYACLKKIELKPIQVW
ncbi:hypothetical protein DPEC_G00244000 [Dallia pectoralis]|uniref:Uncharacterized protein n=1 Tax=Dallia pectoralis TaxID=75939 RepID=A0ACC2FVL0_DALPE|nr:hypothetical protein DPEC_G00244000 [Dallia pectoralis]